MRTIHVQLNHQPMIGDDLCMAVGYFDGIHQGHQALIETAKKQANEKGLKSAVLSFDPNPSFVLGNQEQEHYLSSLQDRKRILEAMGIDYFIILDFTKAMARLSKDQFIQLCLKDLRCKQVVCGFDFFFGYKGEGDGAYLSTQLPTTIIHQVSNEQQKISTTRIIHHLKNGEIDKANQLLTRPYALTGCVVPGKKRGRTICFPTANLEYGSYYLPRTGVYAVKVKIGCDIYFGMCNIGMNPTFDDISKMTCETHIFDYDGDLYGKTISLYFYTFIRSDHAFKNIEELKQQLSSDEKKIRQYFAKNIDTLMPVW